MGAYHPCLPEFCRECERFGAWYRLSGSEEEARAKAAIICLEQAGEFAAGLSHDGFLRGAVLGQIDRIEPVPGAHPEAWRALVTYPNEVTGYDLSQVLSTLYGTVSLQRGIRLDRLKDCPRLWERFRGPRFGRDGLRERLDAPQRPLLCATVHGRGLDAGGLAQMAYRLAAGGIDIVKEDHNVPTTDFEGFAERVARCSDAVMLGAERSGRRSLYAANVTGPVGDLPRRAQFAKEQGAGALLVCPGLVGFDAMRALAADDALALPILAHPAMLGSLATSADSGIAHYVLFGQLMRLAGADATIFPHVGPRFGFTLDECCDVALGAAVPMGTLKAILPAPGGKLGLEQIPDLMDVYGNDMLLLLGGDLVTPGADLEDTCSRFVSLIEEAARAWSDTDRNTANP